LLFERRGHPDITRAGAPPSDHPGKRTSVRLAPAFKYPSADRCLALQLAAAFVLQLLALPWVIHKQPALGGDEKAGPLDIVRLRESFARIATWSEP
jgi:hypothetical protein